MGVPTFNSDEILGFSTTPETKERNSVPLSLQSEIVSSPPGVRREFPGSAAAGPDAPRRGGSCISLHTGRPALGPGNR